MEPCCAIQKPSRNSPSRTSFNASTNMIDSPNETTAHTPSNAATMPTFARQ